MKTALTTTRLAKLAGVHQTTILKAIQAGKIPAMTTPGGHFRITLVAARAFLRSMRIDPGPLLRRKVRVIAMMEDPALRSAFEEATASNARYETWLCTNPLETGMLATELKPEIVVLDTRLLNGNRASTLRALRAIDARVLALTDTMPDPDLGDDEPGAWLMIPFSNSRLRQTLRRLAGGRRTWRRVSRQRGPAT